ncbi:MAG: acyltransferase [Cyanobacteria bacterium REEB65]|nr:acyltransferase [Cyanobacteria bacterium REEB65]
MLAEALAWKFEGLAGKVRAQAVRLRFGERLAASDARLEADINWQIGVQGRVWLGSGVRIRRGSDLKIDGELRIGDGTLIGAWNVLSVLKSLVIGKNVLIAERVSIRDHDHRYRGTEPISRQGFAVAPVRIGDGAWIGAGVVVCEGVELGEGCIVGANSVVLASFGPGTILGGAPARPIGCR